MRRSITVRAARAILNGQYIGGDIDAPVPFERAELYDGYRRGMVLFCVPEGSLTSYPSHIESVFHPESIAHEGAPGRQDDLTPAEFVLAFPGLYLGTVGLSLHHQKARTYPFSILTSYEIVSMCSSLREQDADGKCFSGKVRTECFAGVSLSHTHHPQSLTRILSYDSTGKLRLEKGCMGQISPNLGVMVGIRRTVE